MYKTNSSPRGSSNFLKRNFLKITSMSLLFLIFSSCSVVPETEYSKPWNGFTSERPPQVNGVYIITKAEHLAWLSIIIIFETKVRFDANIDMGNKNFKGIPFFKGTMDGNGKSIKNLKIDVSGAAGLTQELGDNSTIQNITIESGSIKGKGDAGAFVGESQDSVTLSVLINKASVETAENSTGGIISFSRGDIKINNVQNYSTITGTVDSGGILGKANAKITINNAKNTGNITSVGTRDISDVGGIIGDSANSVTINNAKNTGKITGKEGNIGGIVGRSDGVGLIKIDNAQNSGNIFGASEGAGGIIGYIGNPITINQVRNSGNITSSSTGGGIVGYTKDQTTINNAQNSGNISGTSDGAGGIIGHINSLATTIKNAGNSGNITSSDPTTVISFGGFYFNSQVMVSISFIKPDFS